MAVAKSWLVMNAYSSEPKLSVHAKLRLLTRKSTCGLLRFRTGAALLARTSEMVLSTYAAACILMTAYPFLCKNVVAMVFE